MTDPANSSPTKERLNLISSHLTPSFSNTPDTTIMATPQRDPITCHVLDTTTGRPGANIAVVLCPLREPKTFFHGITSSDGRITNWSAVNDGVSNIDPASTPAEMTQIITNLIDVAGKEMTGGAPQGSSLWKLNFATGEYFGSNNTFFPWVELTFLVKAGEHFHVPLLLGPYSFTTYRGS